MRRDRIVGTHAGGRAAADPRRSPLVTKGLQVVGNRVLVARDAGPVERFLRRLARDTEGPEIDEHQVIVGAARDDAEAFLGQRRGEAAARRRRPRTRSRAAPHVERHGLGRDHVHERTALQTGNTALSIAAACSRRQTIANGPPQCLVRRERHDVGVRYRRRTRRRQ
jgi:hypothetical protein